MHVCVPLFVCIYCMLIYLYIENAYMYVLGKWFSEIALVSLVIRFVHVGWLQCSVLHRKISKCCRHQATTARNHHLLFNWPSGKKKYDSLLKKSPPWPSFLPGNGRAGGGGSMPTTSSRLGK